MSWKTMGMTLFSPRMNQDMEYDKFFNGKCCNMLIYYMYDPISLHGWCELEHFHELFIVTRSVAIS